VALIVDDTSLVTNPIPTGIFLNDVPPLFRNERPERSERLNAVRGTVKGKCLKTVSQ